MQLTPGAIKALVAGAKASDPDINAIDASGKEFFAPQVCCEDDKQMRALMDIEEFNPVLQVVRTEWHGFYGVVPCIKIYVKDDSEEEMLMMASYRRKDIAKKFHKQWGSGATKKLAPGTRFRLLDYTTRVNTKNRYTEKEEPVILVETIRLEPKPTLQAKLTSFLAKNKFDK